MVCMKIVTSDDQHKFEIRYRNTIKASSVLIVTEMKWYLQRVKMCMKNGNSDDQHQFGIDIE